MTTKEESLPSTSKMQIPLTSRDEERGELESGLR